MKNLKISSNIYSKIKQVIILIREINCRKKCPYVGTRQSSTWQKKILTLFTGTRFNVAIITEVMSNGPVVTCSARINAQGARYSNKPLVSATSPLFSQSATRRAKFFFQIFIQKENWRRKVVQTSVTCCTSLYYIHILYYTTL